MMLLLDLGNSRLKWSFDAGRDASCGALDWTRVASSADLMAHWQGHRQPQRVLGAAVSTRARRARVDAALAELGWPRAQWLVSPARRGALVNGYARPCDLGIDRFVAMLAALERGLAPCVVASCGSALTLDALDPTGHHLGGQIAPGLAAMHAALRTAAPALPDPRHGRCVSWPDSTVDAMQSGIHSTLAGSIERFVECTSRQLGTRPALLVCGGDARDIAPSLRCPWQAFEDAVLRGLAVWAMS